jgi:NAD(P)-dependent dehydrogenase (short-subunit alcohol dehydrogenase family)
MKCVGEPIDIAKMVTFLASDNAKWITGKFITVKYLNLGQNMVVDGGITIKGGWASLE